MDPHCHQYLTKIPSEPLKKCHGNTIILIFYWVPHKKIENNRTPIFRIFFFWWVPLVIPLIIIVVCHFPPRIEIMTSTAVETVSLSYKGGWWPWYNSCHRSNLNCLYLNGKVDPKGMDWDYWKNNHYCFKKSEMKIRPKDFWDISGTLYLCQVKRLSLTQTFNTT